MLCSTCAAIVEELSVSSTRLHESLSLLTKIAGTDKPDVFQAVLQECRTRLAACRNTTAAFETHRASGRCVRKPAYHSVTRRLDAPPELAHQISLRGDRPRMVELNGRVGRRASVRRPGPTSGSASSRA